MVEVEQKLLETLLEIYKLKCSGEMDLEVDGKRIIPRDKIRNVLSDQFLPALP